MYDPKTAAATNYNLVQHDSETVSTREAIEAKIREGYRRFYRRPKRVFRELRDPRRLAGRLARYMTLFRRRAAV